MIRSEILTPYIVLPHFLFPYIKFWNLRSGSGKGIKRQASTYDDVRDNLTIGTAPVINVLIT